MSGIASPSIYDIIGKKKSVSVYVQSVLSLISKYLKLNLALSKL